MGINRYLSIAERRGFFNWMPTEIYLKYKYYRCTGKKLDLDNPRTFNEKLQKLKIIYAAMPELSDYTMMADKILSKNYIAKKIGPEYVIPTIGMWDHFDDIDFDCLPNQFVLKTNHDSGGLVICDDKSKFNKKLANKKLEKSLRYNYYWYGREPQYKNIAPKLFAEPLIHNADNSTLVEYDFFCFNGEPQMFIYCHGDRHKGETRYNDFFLMDGTRLPFSWGYRSSALTEFTPFDVFSNMTEKARILSRGLPFLRVDFYLSNGKALMGEMTFFHWSGLRPTTPPEWDEKLGEWIQLPLNKT